MPKIESGVNYGISFTPEMCQRLTAIGLASGVEDSQHVIGVCVSFLHAILLVTDSGNSINLDMETMQSILGNVQITGGDIAVQNSPAAKGSN